MKLGEMLRETALRVPDRIAVVADDTRLSFAELDRRSNRLANALMAVGLQPGDRIALYLPNGAALIVAIAAVVKTGAVFVPISTRLSTDEVQFIFNDCQPQIVVFAPAFRDAAWAAAADLGTVTFIVTGPAEDGETAIDRLIDDGDPAAPSPLHHDHDDCAIGYTSGTTGKPKGAITTHRNIAMVHGLMNTAEWNMSEYERILVMAPMAHRAGLGRIGNLFYRGATLVIMEGVNAVRAVDLIRNEAITFMALVPTILRLILPEMMRRATECASLRTVVVTGEVFPVPLKMEFLTAFPHVQLHSFLAQTEIGIIFNLRPQEQRSHPDACGRPVPGVEVRFVDAALKDVPPGDPGEVLVRCGAPGEMTTTRGYFQRPDADAEAFIDGGWMRTGDICRMDTDGMVYFVDRAKDMIVSGGLNIYSKEVEQCLIAHPAVNDAAVIGVPDCKFGEAVSAFIEAADGAQLDKDGVIAHCAAKIAGYKKPKHVTFVDALPRNNSGKVNKGQLRAAHQAAEGEHDG